VFASGETYEAHLASSWEALILPRCWASFSGEHYNAMSWDRPTQWPPRFQRSYDKHPIAVAVRDTMHKWL